MPLWTDERSSMEYGAESKLLIAGEVMEVVHDGAAQMAEDEPEYSLEDFLGCRRHAGRISQARLASRTFASGSLLQLRT